MATHLAILTTKLGRKRPQSISLLGCISGVIEFLKFADWGAFWGEFFF